MMVIHVLSIGKTNFKFVEEGLSEYLSRLTHYTKLNWVELPDVKKVDRTNRVQLAEAEATAFLHYIKPNWRVILLDEAGKTYSSQQFSEWVNQHQLYDQRELCFIIGGAYGFSAELKARSDGKLSLSAMTFNHQMVRMLFAEQLYRAFTIIRGEPYHHA